MQGYYHLAIGRYRQCLLQTPGFSLSAAAAIANTALLFQTMNNVDAELETRILLLKVCNYDNPPVQQKTDYQLPTCYVL